MIDRFACPVCRGTTWNELERFTYFSKDHEANKINTLLSLFQKGWQLARILAFPRPSRSSITRTQLNHYQIQRREVLFDIWFPGADKIELTSQYCTSCGFTAYSPRPEEQDMEGKYHYLITAETETVGQNDTDAYTHELHLKRVQHLYHRARKYLPDSICSILDYGGGRGALMASFLADGHDCCIVDYNNDTIDGVTKIGNDINDLNTGRKFDLIVLSHVLEHVVNPGILLSALSECLTDNGVLFAEVPLEIWVGIRIEADPVTHINFFTVNSFTQLLVNNGFRILEQKTEILNCGNNYMEVIWLIARPGTDESNRFQKSDIASMLFPSRLDTIRRVFTLLMQPAVRKILFTINIPNRASLFQPIKKLIESKRNSVNPFWKSLVWTKDTAWELHESVRYRPYRCKIFGIGAGRTGTSSLAEALKILRIKTSHWIHHEEISREIKRDNFRLPLLERYDAVLDNPIPAIYQKLDAQYPGSKFILTVRDIDHWFRSIERFYQTRPLSYEALLFYQTGFFSRELFRKRYTEHCLEVLAYFKDRPGDLLVLDITAGDGWDKLCSFLGKNKPRKPFPWLNRSAR